MRWLVALSALSLSLSLASAAAAQCKKQDPYAPNQTSGQAYTLVKSQWLPEGGADAHLCPGEEDWWAAEVDQGDTIFVTLTPTSLDAGGQPHDVSLRGTNPAGAEVGRSEGSVIETLIIPALADGTYKFAVWSPAVVDEVDYRIEVVIIRTSPACAADAWEPNNLTPVQAALGVTIPGTICLDDVDRFALQAEAGDRIIVDLTYATPLELGAYVLGPMSPVAESESGSGHEYINAVVPSDGTYEVAVLSPLNPWAAWEGDYKLRIQLIKGGCVDDPWEDNDSLKTAADLKHDSWVEAFMCEKDLDFYRIEIPAGCAMLADLNYQPVDGAMTLAILRATGGGFLASSSTGEGNEVFEYTSEEGGEYAVLVRGHDGFEAPYQLEVLVACQQCEDCGTKTAEGAGDKAGAGNKGKGDE